MDYRFGVDDGGPILEQLGASLLLTFNSGHPYTKTQQYVLGGAPVEAFNSSTTPWVSQLDLRIDKTIRLTERLRAVVYFFMINVFDAKNVINVYPNTGSPDDDGWLSNPSGGLPFVQQYGSIYENVYKNIRQYRRPAEGNLFDIDPYFYGPPRQMRLGLRLEY